MKAHKWCLIIIDDRESFAVRVWRYFSRIIGVEADISAESVFTGRHYVLSDDELIRFVWVRADGSCPQKLDAAINKARGAKIYVLVDVRGVDGYAVENISERLKDNYPECACLRFKVVSSYPEASKVGEKEVEPKSLGTLRAVREEMRREDFTEPAKRRKGLKSRHILVTGAGFEIRGGHGGFGMPVTRDILRSMGKPFVQERPSGDEFYVLMKEHRCEDYREGFPIPDGPEWEGYVSNAVKMRAERDELDLYWDLILEASLQRRLGVAAVEPRLSVREKEKVIAFQRERAMRESFRKAILNYDWGYMNQSLVAAEQRWCAWLTTNYTKFADRAIDLVGGDSLPWRIVSTPAEADFLVREEKAAPRASDGWIPGRDRYLFKLHGDIAHLHTMAIAGHDKDLVNPLCIPVESLYHVYNSAEFFLIRSILRSMPKANARKSSTEKVIWHIVGHGLQDIPLLRLIEAVWAQTEEGRVSHEFIIVNPDIEGPRANLCKWFKDALGKDIGKNIKTKKKKAAQYMAELSRVGLS